MSEPALNPLVIALQGIGFGAFLTAAQGLAVHGLGIVTDALLRRMRHRVRRVQIIRPAEVQPELDDNRVAARVAYEREAAALAQARIARAAEHERVARRRRQDEALLLVW